MVQNSHIAYVIGQLNNIWGIFAQFFHIAGLILVLLSVVLVSLRLLGFGLLAQSAVQLAYLTRSWILVGLIFLAASGLFMLIPSASLYYPNPALWFKFSALAVALVVQFGLSRYVLKQEHPRKLYAVSYALISLTLWFVVGLAGRAIGFMAA
ncbi:MAG TPA: DUF6644 family protein [Cellvibrionaceae bacterium]